MMKQLCSYSLIALFGVLVAGCEPPQSSTPQNATGNSDSTDMTQRSGNPFQVRPAARDTLPLLGIMIDMEQNMAAVQAGIWREDYQTVSEAANALVNHPKIPAREVQRIQSILGEEGLKSFVAADESWHNKARELAEAADEEKMEQIVNRTTELIQQCSNCHVKFRAPLRESPKWLER